MIKANKVPSVLLFSLCLLGLCGCSQVPDSLSKLSLPIDWLNLRAPSATTPNVQMREESTPLPKGIRSAILGKKIKAEKEQQVAEVVPLLQRLRSMTEAEIIDLLGSPYRKLHQGLMIIWQYRAARCQWDLYFRENQERGVRTLRDLIVHQQGQIVTDSEDIGACESALRQQQV